MPYVKRNSDNKIVSATRWPSDGHDEQVDYDSLEYRAFVDPDYSLSESEKNLKAAKKSKQDEINKQFKSTVEAIFGSYSQQERDSFAKQESQARDFMGNVDETRTDLVALKRLAVQRGKTMQEVATRIIAKADAAEVAFFDALGVKQSREDALSDAVNVSEVEAV